MFRRRFNPGPSRPPASRKRKFYGIALALLSVYLIYTYFMVARQAELDETQHADAIVVFGAAEYSGKPSPVFRARLDHALALYKLGYAPFIITTGGNGDDPTYSEGGVGRAYLLAAGVPDKNVIAETQSDDTSESAQRVAAITEANHMNTCLVVSDGYHIYRIKRMMAAHGVTAFGAPRPGTRELSATRRTIFFLREVLSLTLWRLHIT